ncbi:S1C family serine protease [Alicyclobacillus tolerans]|uniref:S1-C subfamily serine protease n=1 Tax=Alicyclobacillus tolerans TaxID=90970 RepID=A0ABT9LTS2_9BACL|nr:trypsin-like peptidase domain-containing protein [Alicyclobacillus tengchongensis]MDP9727596.1 S1-C subfamily serine protease [Alicyclobacillus tengchongensis]
MARRKWRDDDLWQSRRNGGARTVLLGIGIFAAFAAGLGVGLLVQSPRVVEVPMQAPTSGAPSSTGALGNSPANTLASGQSANVITRVYNQVKNSICTITAISGGTGKNAGEEDIGTGFLINNQGDIATNAHVVNGQKTVTVTFGQKNYTGIVLSADTLDDLAIVHVAGIDQLPPLPLGNANTLVPGQFVIAIGNPFQLTESVTFGIISGLNRSMPMQTGHVMDGLIQTDAPLNPGNSGGPLLNEAGQVVGIDTAIESPVEGSVGIGFAIPINRLERLLPTLLRGEQVKHAWIGIAGMDIDSYLQSQLDLPVSQGIYVESVTPDSPAAKAGLRGDSGAAAANQTGQISKLRGDGDIIIGYNGHPIQTIEQLTADINRDQPGQVIQLTVLRNGKKIQISVTLGNWLSSSSGG